MTRSAPPSLPHDLRHSEGSGRSRAGTARGQAIVGALRRLGPSFLPARANRFAGEVARGDDGLAILRGGLADPDAACRADAAEALGALGDAQAASALRPLLTDPDREVRTAAAVALAKIGDGVLFPEIVKALHHDDPAVVVGAAIVLGRVGDRRTVPNLVEAFKTDNVDVGAAVAWALGQCGDPAVLPWLTTAVEQGFVPAEACEALGRLGDLKAAPVLLSALEHPNVAVRAGAARALGRLRQTTRGSAFDARIEQLAAQEIVPALRQRLEDVARRVRVCAAVALYELGELAGGRRLIEELAGVARGRS